jgi:predicted dehydrogenase
MINFGILGCARICRRGMIEAIRTSGVSVLAAIASRREETAREWSREFNIPHTYTSYDALLDDPNIHAAYIPLSNDLHLEYTMKAVERGKHVLCEKPLARSVDEAAQMVAAARRHGVILMEAFMWRHHSRVRHAQQMVAAGELGELLMVKMDFSFDIDRNDWRLQTAQGGGALFDLGCYGINAARLFFTAEPIEIAGWSRLYSTGVDMTDTFCLRFPGGRTALIDCSFECPYRNRLELVGTKGAIELPDGVLPGVTSALVVRRDDGRETLPFGQSQQYTEQVKVFCASIEQGTLVQPAEDGLANMQALDNVRRQLATL